MNWKLQAGRSAGWRSFLGREFEVAGAGAHHPEGRAMVPKKVASNIGPKLGGVVVGVEDDGSRSEVGRLTTAWIRSSAIVVLLRVPCSGNLPHAHY